MRKLMFVLVILSANVTSSRAQTICSSAAKAQSLYCAPIATLQQFSVNEKASVSIPIPPAFTALNANIGTEITALPTPSPVSGFLFSFGPGGLRSERDLGPIFSERTGTVEEHKLYIGSSYQFFEFDKVNQVSLKQIPVQFGACTYGSETGCTPYIETSSRLDLKAHQFTTYATFGITTKLDASVAIPFTNVRMGMNAVCSVCAQTQPGGVVLSFHPTDTVRSSTGIGDVIFRVKDAVWKGEASGLSVGADLRVPSGDELNLRGSGTTGLHPFGAFSYRRKYLSPHVNLGYQMNGSSILAAQTNTPKHLPNSLTYAGGVNVGVLRSLGLNLDVVGQTFFGQQNIFLGTVPPLNHPSTQCSYTSNTKCDTETLNTNSVAIGGKYNPLRSLVISGSVLVKADNNALHYKPSPMLGASYTF